MLYTGDKLSSSIFPLWVCQASVSPDQISTFSNIYRHTSPLLTMYHLISSSTNLYWPSTSQYRHILTQYHQVPLIIHHLMSHAQYTWSSSLILFCFWKANQIMFNRTRALTHSSTFFTGLVSRGSLCCYKGETFSSLNNFFPCAFFSIFLSILDETFYVSVLHDKILNSANYHKYIP